MFQAHQFHFVLNDFYMYADNDLDSRRFEENSMFPVIVYSHIFNSDYGDLVYKFRKIIGKNDFPYHFKKIIVRYKKIGYNIDVLRQTACLVVNPIMVNSFAYLFNCTTVSRASD